MPVDRARNIGVVDVMPISSEPRYPSMNTPRPTNLEWRSAPRVSMQWSDGQVREYSVRELRDRCPCATCREKRSQPAQTAVLLPVLSAAEARPLTISEMKPVGNYAYA